MKLWTIHTDDNTGDTVTVYTDEAVADAAALAWCKAHWFKDRPCPEDWQSAYNQIGDCEAFMSYEAHEIDVTGPLDALTRSAKAQLADLLDQVYQMQGLFRDEDGSIRRAIAAAEAWPNIPEDEEQPNA